MKILVIEDDAGTASFISRGLTEQGHVVERAENGRDGLFHAAGGSYDVMIVDRMLRVSTDSASSRPSVRPVSIHRSSSSPRCPASAIASKGSKRVATTISSSRSPSPNWSHGFMHSGAGPPLSQSETVLRAADLWMDLISRKVHRSGREIDLSPREFRLLEYLLRQAGRVVTRTTLLENVWAFHFDPQTNIVETHVSRLRSKIDKGFKPELIETVRGSGYLLRAPSA